MLISSEFGHSLVECLALSESTVRYHEPPMLKDYTLNFVTRKTIIMLSKLIKLGGRGVGGIEYS